LLYLFKIMCPQVVFFLHALIGQQVRSHVVEEQTIIFFPSYRLFNCISYGRLEIPIGASGSTWQLTKAMQHILCVLIDKKGFKPPRASCWLDSFSVSCSSQLYHGNCGCCDGCWSRFTQACIYVKCTSGVSDANVCTAMGQIFHSHPYKSYGIAEWATMPELELATLLRTASCWAFNTQYLRPWLMHLYCIRKKHPSGRIPDYLDLMIMPFQTE
jgi:hypothetical protein